MPDDAYETICSFNMRLLNHKTGSQNTLVHNLVTMLRDSSLEAKAGSRLVSLHNSRGQGLERHAVIQAERGKLCEVCTYVKQRLVAVTQELENRLLFNLPNPLPLKYYLKSHLLW